MRTAGGCLYRLGLALFPSLLALESLFALALSRALYPLLSRARLSAPLKLSLKASVPLVI